LTTQKKASEAFLDQSSWTRKAILNAARIGKFSSDRTVAEYARDIWDIEKVSLHPA
jgi:starch phosphorylase